MQFKYYIIYKPYGMLCQFTSGENKPVLGDLHPFEKDVYAVGRLDADSEGLLLLTNDTVLNHRLLNPKFKHERTYWAQVDGDINAEALVNLSKGVVITVDGKPYHTLPLLARKMEIAPSLQERNPPIRYRKNIPTSWVELTLYEGKNRQVRKMTAAVGFPTLRLVRAAIEDVKLGEMQPGEVKSLPKNLIYSLLKI
jgi:23S rRNA pseudouridine2457 synthase